MKKILFAAILAVASLSSMAQVAVGGATQASTVATESNAIAGATVGPQQNTQGVTVNIEGQATRDIDRAITDSTIRSDGTQHIVYDNAQRIKNTPSVSGPNLTTSNDTCMGSTSGSANVPGIGISFGTTWVDDNCKRLKNSREMWNMGMKAASLTLMCGDKDNREALEMTGYTCPQSMTKEERDAAFRPQAAK